MGVFAIPMTHQAQLAQRVHHNRLIKIKASTASIAMQMKPAKQETTILDKKSPAGGRGGSMFDSGCNLSGVTRVAIVCGTAFHWLKDYRFAIKRIYLMFNDKDQRTLGKNVVFGGFALGAGGNNHTFFFDLAPHDTISKVVVWADNYLANAVQFHLISGHTSPMFGIPVSDAKPTTFCGGAGSQLVGIYGRYGGAINSLGFSFAMRNKGIPSSVDCSLTDETNEECSSLLSLSK